VNKQEQVFLTGIPVLPLRDAVVFPRMVIPLFVGRKKSIQALEMARDAKDKKIFLATQRDASHDDPSIDQIYQTGTVAAILQMLKMSDGAVKLLVEGESRANALKYKDFGSCLVCDLELLEETDAGTPESHALVQTAISEFERFVKYNSKLPSEILSSLNKVDEAGPAADIIAAHLNIKNDEKQKILEMTDSSARIEHVLVKLAEDVEGLELFGFQDLYARLEPPDSHPELAKIATTQFIHDLRGYTAIFDRNDRIVDVKKVSLFTPVYGQANISKPYVEGSSIPAPNRWSPNAVRIMRIIPYEDEDEMIKGYYSQVWIGGAAERTE